MIKCKKCRKKIPSGWTTAFKKIPQTDGTETIEAFHIVCSRNEFYLYEQVPHKMLIWIFVESSMDTIKRIFKQIKRYVKHMLWHGNHLHRP